jgi:hypothetical protein
MRGWAIRASAERLTFDVIMKKNIESWLGKKREDR